MRLFSVAGFQFSVGDLDGAIGKWSRVATFGTKEQNGQRIVFDDRTLGQMIDNAATRNGKIAICQDHLSAFVAQTGRPAPAMGFFYALALISGGRVVRHWSLDGAAAPDAGGMADGLYARLGEITPLGADPKEGLANYASLSPMFRTDAQAEDGTPIGYGLFDVAATNVPFQAGTSIQFHSGATTMAAIGPSDVRPGAVVSDDNGAFGPAGNKYRVKSVESDGFTLTSGKRIAWTEAGRLTEVAFSVAATDPSLMALIEPSHLRPGNKVNVSGTPGIQSGTIVAVNGDPSNPETTVEVRSDYGSNSVSVPVKRLWFPGMSTMANGAATKEELQRALAGDEESLRRYERDLATLRSGGRVENLTPDGAERAVAGLKSAIEAKRAALQRMSVALMADVKVGDHVRVIDAGTGNGPLRSKIGVIKSPANAGAWWVSIDGKNPSVEYESNLEMMSARTGAARAFGEHMNDLMKKLGLAEGCPVADKMSAYSKHAMGEATPDEIKAMADDLDNDADDKAKAMAAKFKRMAAQVEVDPAAGQKKPEEKPSEEMAKFARSLGIAPEGKTGAQLLNAIQAATVPAAKLPELVKLSVQEAMGAERKQGEAAEKKQRAAVLMSALPASYPGDRAALQRLAESDPDEAVKIASAFLPPSGVPAHLFGRMTAMGAPLGQFQAAREMQHFGGPDVRTVKFGAVTNAVPATLSGERLSGVVTAMADSEDPTTKAKLFSEMAAFMPGVKGTKWESYARYRAAERIVAREQPDLVRAAQAE
jgi:hypothetical protein